MRIERKRPHPAYKRKTRFKSESHIRKTERMCEASAYATENGRICDFKMVALTKTIVYVPKVRSHMRLKYGRINFFRSHICAAYLRPAKFRIMMIFRITLEILLNICISKSTRIMMYVYVITVEQSPLLEIFDQYQSGVYYAI